MNAGDIVECGDIVGVWVEQTREREHTFGKCRHCCFGDDFVECPDDPCTSFYGFFKLYDPNEPVVRRRKVFL